MTECESVKVKSVLTQSKNELTVVMSRTGKQGMYIVCTVYIMYSTRG